MANTWFQFKQFIIHQDKSAMKVTTDSCLFGAWVADQLKGRHTRFSAVDIGAGTGLLSLMIAQACPTSIIDAVEIEDKAASQTQENVQNSPFRDQINVIHTDVRKLRDDRHYDMIISNPPFYETSLKSENRDRNTAHHGDQLTFKELLSTISLHSGRASVVYLLLPASRENEATRIAISEGFHLSELVRVRESANHPVTRIFLQLTKNLLTPVSQSNLQIRDEDGNYASEFVRLLSDYYLNL